MFKTLRAFTLLSAILVGQAASAATIFTATLTGSQEVPPRDTPANGTGTATLDDSMTLLAVSLEWTGLLAPADAAHIHCCPGPGDNGPVAIDFVPFGVPSVVSGTFEHEFDLTTAAVYGGGFLASHGGNVDAARAAVIAGLTDGLAYFNIHTAVYQGGEIRGDIPAVPEPFTMLLMGLGLGAVLLARRAA